MSDEDVVDLELTEEQLAHVDALREMADVIEAHPELCPTSGWASYIGADYVSRDGESSLDFMARIAREVGGRWEKSANKFDGDFQLTRQFGPYKLVLYTRRENVCERVVTGTRTVTRPDPDAEDTRPLVEVEEEVVEWVCPESLLAQVQGEAA